MKLNLKCPIHKDEDLHILYFNRARKIKVGGNKYKRTGDRIMTDFAICTKCNKVRKIKVGTR